MDLKEGQFYSNESIKKRLSVIKDVAGVVTSNCLLNMNDFYEVKPAKRNGKNGYIIEFKRFS